MKKWLCFCIILLLCGCSEKTIESAAEVNSVSNAVYSMKQEAVIEEQDTVTIQEPQAIISPEPQTSQEADEIVLGFAGDINFDENWPTMQYFKKTEKLSDCIENEIIEDIKACDLFMLNNEFTYSTRGVPMEGKMYTFRADPTRVELLKEMGVDLVLLANNHVFDYGKEAILDTLDVLEQADIDYVGAGRNMEDACRICYYELNGMKIAYVAASRAEKNKMTPQATDQEPGILRAYDSEKFLELVREADQSSDFVIANIHWGTEYSYELEDVQVDLGHALVDAGADAVIGTHPHVLQGIEFYSNVPIFYSLGNFWFNEKDLYSGYVKLIINPVDGTISSAQLVPCIQKECSTRRLLKIEEKEEFIEFMESISTNITFSKDGIIHSY